jgi:hypothetical protein
MSERPEIRAIDVLAALAHLIAVNVDNQVVLYGGGWCRKAVSRAKVIVKVKAKA